MQTNPSPVLCYNVDAGQRLISYSEIKVFMRQGILIKDPLQHKNRIVKKTADDYLLRGEE
ncbi:hypothetical protein [Lacrimispora sp.]|uniref:hypothetical protein n=1 Tax=Lacrimispora sp. TaxID=2719234 RepID=UPI00345FB9A0